MYLIDSDILIYLSRGRTSIQQRMNDAGISNCFVSEISLAELYVGVCKGIGKEAFVDYLKKNFKVLPITPALRIFAQSKVQLEMNGTGLDKMDLFIAATALANDYTLVTHNTRHFSRIPGLRLEDWIETD